MQKIFYSLKKKDGSSGFEIIIWFSILLIIFTMFFLFRPSNLKDYYNTSKETIVTSQKISQADLNKSNSVANEDIKPVLQNVTINNIVQDKNTSFWSDFNMNVLSDLTATILIGALSFFAGIFMKNRHSKKLK